MATRNQKLAATREAERLPAWTPFERARPVMNPVERHRLIDEMVRAGKLNDQYISPDRAAEEVDRLLTQEMWKNSRYTVTIDRDTLQPTGWPKIVHLIVKRNDRECPREERWRDFQRIKTELIGPEHEAVELYPAESRVVDAANSWHLWVLMDEVGFPFGFAESGRIPPMEGSKSKQRPFDD
jgi:hypothetical protein